MITLKKIVRNWLLPALLLPALLTACTDDTFTDNRTRVEEGLPARITLGFQARKSQIETRAAQGEVYENQVNNLYVFIFDKAGEIHYRKFFDTGDIDYQVGDNLLHSGSIDIETKSLNDARIVCIANLSNDNVHTSYEVTQADMDAVPSLDKLNEFIMKMSEQTVERSTQFMMTGYAYKDINNPDDIYINIPGSEQGTVTLTCKLAPERTDAKVKFVVKTEIPADKVDKWSEMDFRPRGWKVVNVPAQSMLLPKETGDADGDGCTYFETAEMPFEAVTRDENYRFTEGSFVFYMPENRKMAANLIPDDVTGDAEKYALREKREKVNEDGQFPDKPGQAYEQGDFTYAPANATYVVMSGTLTYKDGADYTVNADVTFTVHLGYANGNANDYNTLRNTFYTYNVTLRGVDNIVVEVTNENQLNPEPRPGYEGTVVFSREGMHQLDAHYDRELITLDRSQVPDMGWGVQTPFSKGIFTEDTGSTPEEAAIYDYKWIKFAINDDYGIAANEYVKYPGDQNYKGTDGGKASPSYPDKPAARLLDIHQLLQRLRTEYYNEGKTTGTVAVTAFVDEYVYFTHPKTGADMLAKWREYVEAEDRLMYFTNGANSKYSPDGASSVVEAIQTFKQKSIRTVYNVKKSESELPTAWGLESVMEADTRWKPGDVSLGTERSNGRLNTLKCILKNDYDNNEVKSLKWTDVLNTSDRYSLNGKYQDAVHAVLMRNRDLNGDGYVQPNEIRWYLAAIDQLTDLYIGEYALDEDSRLYPANKTTAWHYTSSSYDSSQNGPWVLWAEECAALGNYKASSGNVGNTYAYRCMRNLGIDLDNPNTEPTPLIPKVTQAESDGSYLIDASNLSEKARRLSFEAGSTLGAHSDTDPQNRPYEKFRVAPVGEDYNNMGNKPETYAAGNRRDRTLAFNNDANWSSYQTITLRDGYRLPNLRELLIMGTRLPDSAWKTYKASYEYWFQTYTVTGKAMYLSMTSFSRRYTVDGYSGREGFRFNAKDQSIGVPPIGDTGKGYVHGVKDVQ